MPLMTAHHGTHTHTHTSATTRWRLVYRRSTATTPTIHIPRGWVTSPNGIENCYINTATTVTSISTMPR